MSEVRHLVYPPAGILTRYVREILCVRSERPRMQMLLPETTLTLVLRQSGRASLANQALPDAILSGLQQRTRLVEHAAHSSLIIVRFTEVGASAILHDRVDHLYNQTMPLANLLPRQQIDDIQNSLPERVPSTASSSQWNASSPAGSNGKTEPLRAQSLPRSRPRST